jgi:hypothetical protein
MFGFSSDNQGTATTRLAPEGSSISTPRNPSRRHGCWPLLCRAIV